jgi:hypothetical protein
VELAETLLVLSQVLAFWVWRYANMILIATLRESYPAAQAEAGNPDESFVADWSRWHGKWVRHIQLLRFRRATEPAPHLAWAYWLAFLSGWYLVVGLALLLAWMVTGAKPLA